MKPSKGSNQSIDFSVTIDKEASGLGLEIVGGSDTYLGEVIVKSIEPKSAASRDGRIAVGDQLLMINNKSLRGMKHSSAVSSLRLASSPITITLLREDPESIFTSREEPSTVFEVKLIKSITDHLGLSILARKDRRGVFVTYVSEDGVAYKDGSIHQGDKILEVNGQNLKQSTQQETCKAIRVRYLLFKSNGHTLAPIPCAMHTPWVMCLRTCDAARPPPLVASWHCGSTSNFRSNDLGSRFGPAIPLFHQRETYPGVSSIIISCLILWKLG